MATVLAGVAIASLIVTLVAAQVADHAERRAVRKGRSTDPEPPATVPDQSGSA